MYYYWRFSNFKFSPRKMVATNNAKNIFISPVDTLSSLMCSTSVYSATNLFISVQYVCRVFNNTYTLWLMNTPYSCKWHIKYLTVAVKNFGSLSAQLTVLRRQKWTNKNICVTLACILLWNKKERRRFGNLLIWIIGSVYPSVNINNSTYKWRLRKLLFLSVSLWFCL